MEILFVAIIVILGSILTFFSGFGLGTILLPIFILFFPLKIAIAATAIVHFSNSVFKFIYIYKHLHLPTLLRFGIPAVLASMIGAYLISGISDEAYLYSYTFQDKEFDVSYTSFFIGFLITLFTLLELLDNRLKSIGSSTKVMIFGGFLSGFFGGLSGHQGALRSLFLKKLNLSKETFVATSTTISLGIDLVRIFMYLQLISLASLSQSENMKLILVGVIAAFAGATIGNRLLKKITMKMIQGIVSVLLLIFGLLMTLGWV